MVRLYLAKPPPAVSLFSDSRSPYDASAPAKRHTRFDMTEGRWVSPAEFDG